MLLGFNFRFSFLALRPLLIVQLINPLVNILHLLLHWVDILPKNNVDLLLHLPLLVFQALDLLVSRHKWHNMRHGRLQLITLLL